MAPVTLTIAELPEQMALGLVTALSNKLVDVPRFKLAVPKQPLPSDNVAEYIPDVFVEIVLVVAPLDQEYCQMPGTLVSAVIVLELPGQILAGTLLSVTNGCETTTVDVLVAEQPLVAVIMQV